VKSIEKKSPQPTKLKNLGVSKHHQVVEIPLFESCGVNI
jgi:hypothetical protein